MYTQNYLNRLLWWLEGWCNLADGLCMILSVGFYSPLLSNRFANWRLDKALRDPFSLGSELLPQDKLNRLKARLIARGIWRLVPKFTITAVSRLPVIHEAIKRSDDTYYSARTVREWIKDLCPDRSPGRRPNT